MVREKTVYSIAGMVVGGGIVLALGVIAGLDVIGAAILSVAGIGIGGWIAERFIHDEYIRRPEGLDDVGPRGEDRT